MLAQPVYYSYFFAALLRLSLIFSRRPAGETISAKLRYCIAQYSMALRAHPQSDFEFAVPDITDAYVFSEPVDNLVDYADAYNHLDGLRLVCEHIWERGRNLAVVNAVLVSLYAPERGHV